MIFPCKMEITDYVLSSLTKPDPRLIESNCTNLVPDKPLLKNKKTKLVYGYFSLISLIKTNIYFYQFSRFFQNILHFRAFHCSQWKTLFISRLLRGNLSKRDEPKLAGYQSAKDARCSPGVFWAPVKNIERQNYQVLVQRGGVSSVLYPKVSAWTGYRKKIKGILAQW